MSDNKVCVFVDVGNQYHTINKKWEGGKLNYVEYLRKASTYGTVKRAFAYGTQVDDTAAKFITALHHMGYEPQYKQVDKNTWFSWGVGIAMEIVRQVTNDKVDVIILGASGREMAPAVRWAREKGVRVIIIGCGINKELKNACDSWIEIDESMLEKEKESEPDVND